MTLPTAHPRESEDLASPAMNMNTFSFENRNIVYAHYGKLAEAGDNCILILTYYTGTHASYMRMIGPGRALDPDKYFIVIPNMLGNGVSSSPSNHPHFTNASIAQNVACQHELLKSLGVKSIALAYGWSMGAMQSYAWAAQHPGMVKSLLAVCGSAKCWPLNHVFLEGIKAAMGSDGNRAAFGRAYAGWTYSAQFYRDELYKPLGYETLDAFLKFWEDDHLTFDHHDLLAMLWTWQNANLGPIELSRITAKTIIMPADTDMYFTEAEARIETSHIPNATLRILHSPYGHCAGAPGRFPLETAQIEQAIKDLLA
jgi:homoserine O-acetyltransferase